MADQKQTENIYNLLGGVNQKTSDYALTKSQFLDIRNLDFDVVNALQKRPGSSFGINGGTSGPITSLFEFKKLEGQSYLIAGSDTAMFFRQASSNGLTLLDPGWNNGQPTDMLTFVNKLWMANGQNFKWWDGSNVSPSPVGLPCPKTSPTYLPQVGGGASVWTTWGAFTTAMDIAAFQGVGIFAAYSYVRSDGYFGPLTFANYARNIAGASSTPATSGSNVTFLIFSGITVPSGFGITAVAIYLGFYPFTAGNYVDVFGSPPPIIPPRNGGNTLGTAVDVSRFRLYTLASIANQTFTVNFPSHYSLIGFDSNAQFTGMNFCWFDTNTPKYIDVSQNIMISAGFSQTPSVAWVHDLGAPEIIQPENSFEVRTNDGDRIFGVSSYAGTRLLFKEASFHKLIGDSPENYELIELSNEIGCISQRTIVQFKEKLVWLDRKGVILYDGASWDYISDQVEDIFRRMNLTAAMDNATAVNHIYRNQIWFGIPVDGATQNNITVVYDYLIGAWTFFDGFNPASFAFIKQELTKGTVWRGDYSGMIHYHGESFYSDSGQGITCLATPHWEKIKENEVWNFRRFFLDMVPSNSGITGVINANFYSNYDRNTVQHTATIYQDDFQTRLEMGVIGKAATVEFSHHSASLPLLINGYSWARRFLRNV